MAVAASLFDQDTIEAQTLRWNEDLTAVERGRIASSLESARTKPEYKWVPVGDLYVDESYQRGISQARVWDIVTNFSWNLFQALWVGERRGKLYIVDGRHRFAAAQTLGAKIIPKLPCEIRRTTSVEEEAGIFVDLTEKRRTLSALAKFRARLVQRDSAAIAIEGAMKRHGLVGYDEEDTGSDGGSFVRTRDGSVGAFGRLFQAYDAGGRERVDNVLYMVKHAWDAVVPTQGGPMIQAFSRLFEMHPTLNRERVAKRLGEQEPWGIIERGQRFAHSNGISTTQAIADVLAKYV